MNNVKKVLLILVVSMLLGVTAWAEEKKMQEPKVEYSADEYMETEQMTSKSKVFHAVGKERREQDMAGMNQIMIIRRDTGVTWMLMPEQKMYMETRIGGPKRREIADLDDYQVEHTVVGDEVVNGINTTKNKVIVTGPQGNKLGGFMWVSKDGIMVKMDVVGTSEGTKARIKKELKNLTIEKQDPNLFEIPSGYSSMTMPGMGGGLDIKKMMKGLH